MILLIMSWVTRRRSLLLITTTVVIGLGLAVVLQAASKNLSGNPKITWSLPSLRVNVSGGASNAFQVSFVASDSINDAILRVVPELQPFVHVTPSTISAIAPGQPVTVTITVAPSALTAPQMVSGTIQLRVGDGNGKTIPNPLPVALNILWTSFSNATAGVQFSYPDFGSVSKVETSTNESGGTRLDVQFQSANGTNFVSGFNIFLLPNTNHLSLSDWFQQNVDPDGSLTQSGAFVQKQFGNGILALVLSGPIPQAYTDKFGPVMSLYGISASGNTIIVMSQSQVNEFDLHGLTNTQIVQMLEQVLVNLQAP